MKNAKKSNPSIVGPKGNVLSKRWMGVRGSKKLVGVAPNPEIFVAPPG